jgi:nucleoside-diphosphate kinase
VKGITLDKLYTGSIVSIFSRQLKIIDYCDVYTRKHFEQSKRKFPPYFYHSYILNRTLAMVKPDAYKNLGKILSEIEAAGFIISNIKMAKMSVANAH